MPEVNMPKLSDTMEEGTVLTWRVPEGAEVHRGDAIAEIESDKASFDIEAEADGILHILVEVGRPVPVGQVIATVGEGAASATKSAPAAPAVEAAAPAVEAAAPAVEAAAPAVEAAAPASDAPEAEAATPAEPGAEPEVAQPAAPAAAIAPPDAGAVADPTGVRASPLARRLATERGVDLSRIRGTGPEGRIVKEDVMGAASSKGAAGPAVEIEQPNRMQSTIARRMTLAKSQVPHFYVTVEARVDDAVHLRKQLQETYPEADRVTITDMIIRAAGLALAKFPEVNSSWIDDHFERHREVHIGLAVASADGLGLLVPVLHNVDRKDLVAIAIESRQVIERARAGRPQSGDLEGGGFSISNLGMFGVDEFQAIINPPESAILAVGAVKQVPVVDDSRVVPGTVMRMTLSADHRVFYGATAALFLGEIKRLLEHPLSLILDPSQS